MIPKSSIGIFDSGFGGLSILKEIVKKLPQYDYVYLGDTARAPYGSRSQETIYEFTKNGIEFLFKQNCNLVILACNTASAEALRRIQQEFLPQKYPDKKVLGVIRRRPTSTDLGETDKRVLGVLIPASEEAVLISGSGRIGVLGTEATVHSRAFKREILKLNPEANVFEIAAPLLVPLVESGEEKSQSAKLLVTEYVKEVLKHNIDTLILGCTHYSFFENEIKRNAKGVKVITGGKVVARKLEIYLAKHIEIEKKLSKKGEKVFYTTDNKEKFDRLGARFFGSTINSKKISLDKIDKK